MSQTDTEIVALWIGVHLDKGITLSEAIEKTVQVLEGAYSFVLISTLEPEAMYIVKNTGTMVIGVSKDLERSTQRRETVSQESDLVASPSVEHE